jgi:hypothetical protein
MKKLADISSFTAGSGGSGTVIFGAIAPADIKEILLVTDVTSQTIIYNPFDSTKGGSYNSGTKTLTLEFNTTGLTGTSLQAWFWDEASAHGQKTMSNSLPVAIASDQSTLQVELKKDGLGVLTACPAASTNGTAIGSVPSGARAVRIYLNSGDAISFTIASSAPGSAPSAVINLTSANISNWDEPLPSGMNLYITAKTGNPLFRFI